MREQLFRKVFEIKFRSPKLLSTLNPNGQKVCSCPYRPRFVRRNAKKETKVTDERFSALATDKEFSFGLSAEIDKYGRKQVSDEEHQQAEKNEELKQARLNRLARGEASGSDYSTGSSSSESSANESSDSESSESDGDLDDENIERE